ncbi:Glycosyl transferase family 2 [Tangfeifania diversioriginum]|uniref:Glycosyl transferase family 2 n=1 Tax=Tangfeifania diversioriginum TaxID=1168035 RepID=A0A1M6PWD2_9BACT|nr:glycosyltransferase family 2 protein [Tangfeifania diversioriginum]SHK12241.1 Glycosyl transferase family 2 [Tangfeifania diversioriginum]
MQTDGLNKISENILISIVLSLYNEEAGVLNFWTALQEELAKYESIRFELIWVNDGSKDRTQYLIDKKITKNNRGNITHCTIEFSKNFGHEAAMIAGIDHAKGDAVICMDSDGQHPPSEIPKMIASFLSGNDCVLMERTHREDNGMLKKWFSSLFYRIINKLSTVKFRHNASDFWYC